MCRKCIELTIFPAYNALKKFSPITGGMKVLDMMGSKSAMAGQSQNDLKVLR
jgi:hypothetical protein